MNSTKSTVIATPTPTAIPIPPIAANDNDGGHPPDTIALVARRDVVRYLAATLRRYGVSRADMDDAIADVQTRAIESARFGRMPATVAHWKALTAAIAARWAASRLREAEIAGKHDAGLCDDSDACARPALHREQRDPVDTKRYLAVLKGLFESGQMPPDGAEILWGVAEDVPRAQIAVEIGVAETTVRNRLLRMRATFRAKLAVLGMLVLLLLTLVTLLLPVIDVAAPAPETTPPKPAQSVESGSEWDSGVPIFEKSSFPAR